MSRMERPGAPEGTTVNVGAAPVGRRDFGLAEELARVERAALDWGVRDLAQAAWCRLLRSRRSLKPDGNLPAYLATIATNCSPRSSRDEGKSRRSGVGKACA